MKKGYDLDYVILRANSLATAITATTTELEKSILLQEAQIILDKMSRYDDEIPGVGVARNALVVSIQG